MFKVGDMVKITGNTRSAGSKWVGTVGVIAETMTGNLCGSYGVGGYRGIIYLVNKLWYAPDAMALVSYEDGWTLNDGKVDIPVDAKTLKDETGDIVAFKKMKVPVVREIVEYVNPSANFQGLSHTDGRYADSTYKLVYTVTDNELTGVRLEKL